MNTLTYTYYYYDEKKNEDIEIEVEAEYKGGLQYEIVTVSSGEHILIEGDDSFDSHEDSKFSESYIIDYYGFYTKDNEPVIFGEYYSSIASISSDKEMWEDTSDVWLDLKDKKGNQICREAEEYYNEIYEKMLKDINPNT